MTPAPTKSSPFRTPAYAPTPAYPSNGPARSFFPDGLLLRITGMGYTALPLRKRRVLRCGNLHGGNPGDVAPWGGAGRGDTHVVPLAPSPWMGGLRGAPRRGTYPPGVSLRCFRPCPPQGARSTGGMNPEGVPLGDGQADASQADASQGGGWAADCGRRRVVRSGARGGGQTSGRRDHGVWWFGSERGYRWHVCKVEDEFRWHFCARAHWGLSDFSIPNPRGM